FPGAIGKTSSADCARYPSGSGFPQKQGGLGAPWGRIVFRHLWPNVEPTVIVLATSQVGFVLVAEAALSFIGAGIPPPAPAWGSMIAAGREYLVQAWWISLFPGLAIMVFVLAVNATGEWLRERSGPRALRR